jgi:hypothetical protein
MIPDAIKDRLTAQPFKPFVLKLGSGEKFEVRHPELVSLSPGGRRMILWVGDEKAVDIDVLLVESLQDAGKNGHNKRRSA